MLYLKKISSLEERASAQVAINLCQESGFMEVALCLEKPTYGTYFDRYESSTVSFVSNPEELSAWAKMKEVCRLSDDFKRYSFRNDKDKLMRWEAAIDEQCQRLSGGLPSFLKHGVHAWINRIAWEYLSYSRRQEGMFGVSRYFLMDVLTREDWMEAGRLDEKKLAKRLVKDERLTVSQRYNIACAYCLHVNIPRLWDGLTQSEKRLISHYGTSHRFYRNSNLLVLLCSYQQDLHQEGKVTQQNIYQWTSVAEKAARYGNQAALMWCWKRLEKHTRQQIVIDMALKSLETWQLIIFNALGRNSWRKRIVLNELPSKEHIILYNEGFNLPSYYSRLMCFFLSQMDEEQELTFFKKAFQRRCCDCVLECFLEWPHQDVFLPMIKRLWGIIPKVKYEECLLALARKYSRDDEKENRYYDYRSLLWNLWEETPEEYKQYVFLNKNPSGLDILLINEGKVLFPWMLGRSPLQKKDEALFKRVFRDLPQEERRAMICSEVGENICSILTQKEKWSFMNWLLEECLPKEEIPSFKKQYIQSKWGRKLCLSILLVEKREKLLEDLINWSIELDIEKTQFKYQLIRKAFHACNNFLCKGEFSEVERVINFCVSAADQGKFKVLIAKYTCGLLLEDCAWEQIDKILAWSVNSEEKIRYLKKELFSETGVDVHYSLLIQRQWEKVGCFYKYFDLLPEEIEKFKKDTIFSPTVFKAIYIALSNPTITLVPALLWCLSNEQMVTALKQKIENECLMKEASRTEKKKAKKRLDFLMRELLFHFWEKPSRADNFRKSTGNKRSFEVIEDNSISQRKRFMSSRI